MGGTVTRARTAALDEAVAPLLDLAAGLLPDEKRALVDSVTAKVYATRRRR